MTAIENRVPNNKALLSLEEAVNVLTGIAVSEIRNTSLEDFRRKTEAKARKPFRIVSRFPFIGRGNVMRDRLVSHEQVEQSLDCSLK